MPKSLRSFAGWSQLAEAFMADQVNVAHFLMPMTVWMRYGIGFSCKSGGLGPH